MAIKDYLPGKGCCLQVKKGGKSAYAIDGFPTAESAGTLIVIDNIIPKEGDIVTPVEAVDNYRILYTFGKSFGQIFIRGRLCIGATAHAKNGDRLVAVLQQWFEENRVSTKMAPVNVSIAAGKAYKVYLIDMTLEGADAEFNILPFSFTGAIAPEPQ